MFWLDLLGFTGYVGLLLFDCGDIWFDCLLCLVVDLVFGCCLLLVWFDCGLAAASWFVLLVLISLVVVVVCVVCGVCLADSVWFWLVICFTMELRCLLGLIWMIVLPVDGWCINVVRVVAGWRGNVGCGCMVWVPELQLFQVGAVCVGIDGDDCEAVA